MNKMGKYNKLIIIVMTGLLSVCLGGCTGNNSEAQLDAETTMSTGQDTEKDNQPDEETVSKDKTDADEDSEKAKDDTSSDSALTDSDKEQDKTAQTEVIPFDYKISSEKSEDQIKSDDGAIILYEYTNSYPKVTSENNPAAAEKINKYYESMYSPEANKNKDVTDIVGKEDISDTTDISEVVEWAKEDYQMKLESGSKEELENWVPYSDDTSIAVSNADEKIISFLGYSYMYTGGAHGNYVVYGDNFDSQTGEKLTFADLVEDEATARAFVEEQITIQADQIQQDYADGKSEFALFDEYKEYIPDVLTDDTWYLTDEGFEVVANIYLIAPYAAGDIHFKIPYDQCDFIKEKYRK